MKKFLKALVVLVAAFCVVLAAKATLTNDVTVGSAAFSTTSLNKTFVIENTATFTTNVAAASNDIIRVLNVPADTVVMFVEYKVLTTNATSVTFDIGDDGSRTRWKSNADANTAGAVLGTATPYLYTAADTIDVTVDGEVAAGTVRVRAFCVAVDR